MENFCVSFCFFFPSLIILAMLAPSSTAQLSPSETRTLFQIQKLLEYPEALQGWNNWTSFCYLPPSPSLTIVCTNNQITEFTVIGNKSSPSHSPKPASGKFTVSQQTLSETFSTDSLFSVLAKLSNLKVLSLVSLGLWGPLPAKINRLWSLEVINISSNFIYGEIPSSISTLKNLTSLVLAENLFNGSIPYLKSLVLLQELNLGGNNIGPEFPSLSNSLVSITLSNNSLRSEIPSEVKNFAKLQQFDISSNKFLGPIPPSLFSLPSIQYLSLAQNQLSGVLPMNISCNAELKFVDISQNLLIGKLPSCLGSNSSNRSVLYSWNCLSSSNYSNYQHPSVFCNKEALAVKPPNKSKEKESKSNINFGLVLVIIGCVVAIAVVLGLLVLFIVRRAERNRSDDNIYNRSVAEKMSIRSSSRSYTDARRVAETIRLAALGLPPYRVFTLEEIEDATNNFDPTNLIGEGSQGQLYKGWVRDGSVVLVKSLKLKQKHLSKSLMQPMDVLSKLRHRHLRMAITIGVARGVQFLHTGITPGIFGNKLKIDNILLDDSLTAKISSYNIPLPFKLDSESPLGGQDNRLRAEIAEKEDIYQLGVILLQVITGKLVTSASETNELKLELEKGLTESKLRAATDPSIQGTFAYQSLKTTVEITINCLGKDPSMRPSIEDVLWNLQYSIQVQEGWTSSGNVSTQM
ncbi:putative lrr receptor-like serine/threonine-protein kinase [Quercus suber]|uniref:non-specific serine/threonine protein kinase n=1 Tax=Quercus suber TaxID=58331 RepID=A0AAW0JDR0_QUESU